MAQPTNVIRDYGASRTHCAYCQNPSRFCVHGMMTATMTAETCQDLVDIGWTRAGYYMYKPDLRIMCCPSYTIRLNTEHFIPSRNQKRALRKLQSYLKGGALSSQYRNTTNMSPSQLHPVDPYCVIKLALEAALKLWLAQERLSQVRISPWKLKGSYGVVFQICLEVRICTVKPKQRAYLPATVFLTSPLCLALFHELKALSNHRLRWQLPDGVADNFSSFFMDCKETLFIYHFTEKQQRQWRALMQDLYATHEKGYLNFHMPQGAVFDQGSSLELLPYLKSSHSEAGIIPVPQSEPAARYSELPWEFCGELKRERNFSLTWAISSFVEEEYQLYKKYQMGIHGESEERCAASRYEGFLVDTPLIHQAPGDGIPEPGMGSFHMQYRIDDRLVAVGVVDVLPRSLCSAYFFWDPDFAPLSLGKISALMEIDWVKKASLLQPALQYYLIGYYVHSCPKTQYKSDYTPSELLCPETYLWVKLTEDIQRQLSVQPYLVLSSIPGVEVRENLTLRDDLNGNAFSMEEQRLQVFGEVLTLRECNERLNDESPYKEWSVEQMAILKQNLPLLQLCLREWRRRAMDISGQLVYDCSDFLPDC